MVNLILSTGNIMGAAAASMSYSPAKSNHELVRSLRMNIEEAQEHAQEGQSNGDNASHKGHDWKRWTTLEDSGETLYVPSVDFSGSSLSEERDSYDITVKLFHLHPGSAEEREQHTRHALSLVLKELHIPFIDLLIVSYPSIVFEDDTDPSKPHHDSAEPLDSLLQSWRAGPESVAASGLARRLGVAEFGVERLSAFLKASHPPTVDQINLQMSDCFSVPRDLLALAKANDVELLGGGTGAGLLASEDNPAGVKGDVAPRWVVKYTAVVRDRGVVENKGYFALAEVRA